MTHRAQNHGAVRYAAVGKGYIAQAAVLLAFAHAKRNSRLAAIVSGDAAKRHPTLRQSIGKPPVRMPRLVQAAAPGG
jgi:hypothetical protein